MRSGSLMLMMALLVAVAVMGSGCASIVSKSTYPVEIASNPSSAHFTVFDHKGTPIHRGKTPSTVQLKAGRGYFRPGDYHVEFAMDGYEKRTVDVDHGIDMWYVGGNFFIGGLVGWVIVDPITGAMWTLDDVFVDLKPVGAAAAAAP